MDKVVLPVLLGTNRKERRSEAVARWLVAEMRARPDIETTLFDVADFDLPRDDYGQADEAYVRRAKEFLDELVWMSRALRWGRENLPSKYHQS